MSRTATSLKVLLVSLLLLLSISPTGMVSAGSALWSSSSSNGVSAQANTWHVATTGSDSTGDGSETKPFATIQHGIDVASHGETVLVQPGVYLENLNFNGKNITVGSLFITTGDEDYILQTVIDGNRNGHVVTFVNGEAATARLSGFTVTNGYAQGASAPETRGGGVFCAYSSPTLTHLKVTFNEAVELGGGMFFEHCTPTIRDVAITDNLAGQGGGAIFYASGSVNLENVVVSHNSALLAGSGLQFYHAEGTVKNALIADNSGGGKGGGVVFDGCSPTFTNVTIVGNRTTGHGGGMNISYMSQPTLVNSVVWGNTPEQIYYDTQWPGEAVTIEYSDIQDGQAGIVTNGQGPVQWGEGNLEISPRFVHAGLGNYRLADTSPAIGTGKADGAPSTDIEGNPRPNPAGSNPDMGAYENPRGLSSPDPAPTNTFTRITSDAIVNGTASTWHVATTGSDSTGDGSEAQPFATIQHGIDTANHGDTVLVQPGVYRENLNFNGKSITVGSLFVTTDDEDYILQTVIDGNRNGRVVTFVNGEAATAQLSGFTITNGYAHGTSERETYGGGVYCRDSEPTLTHLRVTGNEAVEGGGGLHFNDCSPTVRDVIVTDNRAGHGGGIRYTGGSVSLENVVIAHNSANLGGSGLFFYHADGTIKNALIADSFGGGQGGGLVFDGCSPTFTNVTIVGNRTTGHGGGLNVSFMSQPTLVNSIVWGNTPEQIYFDTHWPGEAVTIEYSDIEGGEAGIVTNGQGPVQWGEGNLEISPRFVHAGLGNYRLADTSPAIGTGKADGAPSSDIEGNPRPNPAGSNPDMGAYEDQPTLWYVNDDGAAGNGCVSWADACPDLQTALGQAASGDEIWVAEGTYTPTRESTPGDPRSVTFQLKNGVALYGGFDPSVGDTGWEDRDWVSNVTVLSGDIGTAGDPADNSYHVFYHPSELALDGSAVLDGFTVADGNGSINSTTDNEGGGMYNQASSPAVRNCTFSGNTAVYGGGMLNRDGASPEVTNCIFLGNSAIYGGGMRNQQSSAVVTNCTFSGNTAYYGGGMANVYAAPVVTNCIFSGNSAHSAGGGMANDRSSAVVTNSILWGDSPHEISTGGESESVVTYSDIQSGYSGEGNIDADPLFVDADGADNVAGTSDDNLRLEVSSPAFNAGSNAAVPAGVTTDLDGAPRISNGIVDMGAYENPNQRWYVNDDGAAGNGCVSWADACPDLQTALGWADGSDQIWVVAGTYRPGASGNRGATFQLKSGVAVYGGFAGTEMLRNKRDWAMNVTVLSGDIGTLGDVTDNSYHVVTGSGTDATAVLDGFTITAGNADGSAPHNSGGGMYTSGGSPTLTNMTFSGNSAQQGGGMKNDNSSSPTLTNVIFGGNSADQGGGMHNSGASNPTLVNVSLSGNSATSYGGAMYNSASTPALANGILWGNTAATSGAQIYNDSSTPSIAYSDIQDAFDASNVWDTNLGTDESGNLDIDPLFVDADGADNVAGTADDNLRLQPGSPATDAGNNAAVPAGVTTDLGANPRIVNDTVDMGAYEYQGVTASPSGDNVLLTFEYAGAGISYQVWRSSNPYFTPVNEGSDLGDICTDDGVTVTCTDENAIGDPSVNSFYVVRALRADGAYADSDHTGFFGFALAPGN